MFIIKQKKIHRKKLLTFMLTAIIVLVMPAPESVYASEILIDGYSDDWADKPGEYVYNWNKGENSVETMHYFQAYNDGAGIAIHIIFSADYWAGVNSEDYNLHFNEGSAKFQLRDANGNVLTNNVNSMEPGRYKIQVWHGDGAVSGQQAENSMATLYIPNNRVNPEIEVYIPYKTCHQQNGNINPDNNLSVGITNPNIMCGKHHIEGAPTGSLLSIIVGLGLSGVFFAKQSDIIERLKSRKTKA